MKNYHSTIEEVISFLINMHIFLIVWLSLFNFLEIFLKKASTAWQQQCRTPHKGYFWPRIITSKKTMNSNAVEVERENFMNYISNAFLRSFKGSVRDAVGTRREAKYGTMFLEEGDSRSSNFWTSSQRFPRFCKHRTNQFHIIILFEVLRSTFTAT